MGVFMLLIGGIGIAVVQSQITPISSMCVNNINYRDVLRTAVFYQFLYFWHQDISYRRVLSRESRLDEVIHHVIDQQSSVLWIYFVIDQTNLLPLRVIKVTT